MKTMTMMKDLALNIAGVVLNPLLLALRTAVSVLLALPLALLLWLVAQLLERLQKLQRWAAERADPLLQLTNS